MVYTCRGDQLRLRDELGWITLARALCPLLMAFVAWQRASACGATWAAILGFVGVAKGCQLMPILSQPLLCWLKSNFYASQCEA
jgi:hypothetical protein